MKAVRFNEYGGIDVLNVVDVPVPVPGPGQVLVKVTAAGINPGEAKIREGFLHSRWPATFPSGQGSDLAGVVSSLGPPDGTGPEAGSAAGSTAGLAAGDEVIGWVDTRSSHAEYALVPASQLVRKPGGLPWEVAGAIPVAGFTAWAMVRAVGLEHDDVVVVSGAAGGVGSLVVQLANRAGATVIGLAGEANHDWLAGHGVIPVAYGPGVADRIVDAAPVVNAFLDTHGGDYVEIALNELGVAPERVDTVVRFDAVEKYGVKAEGNAAGASAATLAEVAGLIAGGDLEIPIAAAYPLDSVRKAYEHLEAGHTRGKIVLLP
jgi:NADPH:quinone reductase-like Zn-dependent oxidoreductase